MSDIPQDPTPDDPTPDPEVPTHQGDEDSDDDTDRVTEDER